MTSTPLAVMRASSAEAPARIVVNHPQGGAVRTRECPIPWCRNLLHHGERDMLPTCRTCVVGWCQSGLLAAARNLDARPARTPPRPVLPIGGTA